MELERLGRRFERTPKSARDVEHVSLEVKMVIRLMLIAVAAVLMHRMIGPAQRSASREPKERSRRNRASRLRHSSFTG